MKQVFPERWLTRMREVVPADEWDDFLRSVITPLPRTFWTTRKFVKPENWRIRPAAELSDAYFLDAPHEIVFGRDLSYVSGHVYPSSLSSLLSVKVLDPQFGNRILDMCAAPGTKATRMAQILQTTGAVLANEMDGKRFASLSDNMRRMGGSNMILSAFDGLKFPEMFGEEFDKVLLDAPCSSDGFGRRDPDFYASQWRERNIFELSKLQKDLIVAAFSVLREGGEMVYSTCTGAPEENEMVVSYLLENFPEAELLPVDLGRIPAREGVRKFFDVEISDSISQNVRRIYPHLKKEDWDSEFFFVAKFRKKEFLHRRVPERSKYDGFSVLPRNRVAEVKKKLFKTFGLDPEIFSESSFFEKDGTVFLCSEGVFSLLSRMPFRLAGIPMFSWEKGITQEFVWHFGDLATRNVWDVEENVAMKFLQGYDLEIPAEVLFDDRADAIVRFGRFSLGYGKVVNGKLKNKLPTHKAWR